MMRAALGAMATVPFFSRSSSNESSSSTLRVVAAAAAAVGTHVSVLVLLTVSAFLELAVVRTQSGNGNAAMTKDFTVKFPPPHRGLFSVVEQREEEDAILLAMEAELWAEASSSAPLSSPYAALSSPSTVSIPLSTPSPSNVAEALSSAFLSPPPSSLPFFLPFQVAPGAPAQRTQCMTLLNRSILTGCRTLLKHEPMPPYVPSPNSGEECGGWIRNIVLARDNLNFFYVLNRYCSFEKTIVRNELSIMKSTASPVRQGVQSLAIGYLISNFSVPDGAPPSGAQSPSMADVHGMTLSKMESHLLLAVASDDPQDCIVALHLINGSRRSVSVVAGLAQGLTFNPNKTHLFFGKRSSRPSYPSNNKTHLHFSPNISRSSTTILSAKIDDPDVPLTLSPETVVTINDSESHHSSWMGPNSFSSDGRCLYFLDDNKLWGFDPMTRSLRQMARKIEVDDNRTDGGGGGGDHNHADGSLPLEGNGNLKEIAATSDGLNVFATDDVGHLSLTTVDSPCGKPVRVENIAAYTPFGLSGLALDDENGVLYVGSSNGLVFEITVDQRKLHHQGSPPPQQPPSLTSSTKSSRRTLVYVVVPVAAVAVILVAIAALMAVRVFLAGRKKRPHQARSLSSEPRSLPLLGDNASRTGSTTTLTTGELVLRWGGRSSALHKDPNPRALKTFSLQTVAQATANFSIRIGEKGAFGYVCCGELEDKTKVAVKVMEGCVTPRKWQQFVTEIDTLSRIHHAHLCGLIGYCQEERRPILVYPYMSGGSLHARLHGSAAGSIGEGTQSTITSTSPLTVEDRLRIASHVASALRYLHEEADPPVLHRDIKSSNVLLNNGTGANLRAYVADFGVATIGESVFETGRDGFVKTSHIRGTRGYIAPEYLKLGELTEKNDVYAFGVLLLETLTARKVFLPTASGEGWETIVDWTAPFLARPVFDVLRGIVDPALLKQTESNVSLQHAVEAMFRLASDCVLIDPKSRPKMGQVVRRLNVMNDVSGMKSSQSPSQDKLQP